ncbi:hypothetical protein [Nannocystis sp. SCPEA4]|uniref:hypothetical protein n=1 Tax=Nannocystis sp. SCPEA4 TaxID=2996787 RepID=UPI00227178F5|nr:hypothetical protein [Nannocystis sp. SCPEA4]MCY1057374.1 hypothetical protein [Nannocystis sp. SCPEA4]
MNPRHGPAHRFTTRAFPGFGRLSQPLLTVRLRRSAAHRWSGPIEALVDTGASITLVAFDILAAVPEFDESLLGPELRWQTATQGDESCRAVALDLSLGPVRDPSAPELLQATLHATRGRLVAPILLGQRGVLDRLGLVHRNVGPSPSFRFLL